jgi:hypothetical protein
MPTLCAIHGGIGHFRGIFQQNSAQKTFLAQVFGNRA